MALEPDPKEGKKGMRSGFRIVTAADYVQGVEIGYYYHSVMSSDTSPSSVGSGSWRVTASGSLNDAGTFAGCGPGV